MNTQKDYYESAKQAIEKALNEGAKSVKLERKQLEALEEVLCGIEYAQEELKAIEYYLILSELSVRKAKHKLTNVKKLTTWKE